MHRLILYALNIVWQNPDHMHYILTDSTLMLLIVVDIC